MHGILLELLQIIGRTAARTYEACGLHCAVWLFRILCGLAPRLFEKETFCMEPSVQKFLRKIQISVSSLPSRTWSLVGNLGVFRTCNRLSCSNVKKGTPVGEIIDGFWIEYLARL